MKRMISDMNRRLRAAPLVGPLLMRVSALERMTLAVIVTATLAFYVFLVLAQDVLAGETFSLDEHILLLFRDATDRMSPLGPPWFEEAMRDLTALGGTTLLTFVTLAALAYLLLEGKRHTAILVAVSVAGGTILSSVLKWGIGRPRPDLVPHGMAVYTASFPSGHSTMSAVVYLTLGALLARAQPRQSVKVFLLGLAVGVTVIVGVSRVYLGVHWPSDVMGGWALGAGWACLCWLAMLWLQSQGEVEREDMEEVMAPRRDQIHAPDRRA